VDIYMPDFKFWKGNPSGGFPPGRAQIELVEVLGAE
jgi:hypothetical protein